MRGWLFVKNLNQVQCQGYIEGYYGRLLQWSDRHDLVEKLAQTKMLSLIHI